MQTNAPDRENGHDSIDTLDNLDAKALTTPMSVLPDQPEVAGAEDTFLVQHTREHIVSKVAGEWVCDCKGYQYHERCYHVKRVAFEVGDREIPAYVNPDAVDDALGEFVEAGPRQAATDGGQLLDDESDGGDGQDSADSPADEVLPDEWFSFDERAADDDDAGPAEDTTVAEAGEWSLVVRADGVVEARKPVPFDGTLYFSTADRLNSHRKNSEYGLTTATVIERYQRRAPTEHDVEALEQAVTRVLAGEEADR